jgi:hypothetical protein
MPRIAIARVAPIQTVRERIWGDFENLVTVKLARDLPCLIRPHFAKNARHTRKTHDQLIQEFEIVIAGIIEIIE